MGTATEMRADVHSMLRKVKMISGCGRRLEDSRARLNTWPRNTSIHATSWICDRQLGNSECDRFLDLFVCLGLSTVCSGMRTSEAQAGQCIELLLIVAQSWHRYALDSEKYCPKSVVILSP